ncbi:UTP--glucose-1-phosphate uridylyltransferase GalU [Guggenheimella bovis]
MKISKAVIPAAGLGTRFLPFTKSMPKEMLNVVDKPTIQYNVEELIESGIDDILIITARNKDAILNHFDETPELDESLRKSNKLELLEISKQASSLGHIHFVRQGIAKGLGHAVLCAESFCHEEPFLVLLGDDVLYNKDNPATKQLIDIYEQTGGSVIAVKEVPLEHTSRYGIVAGEEVSPGLIRLNHIVEKPDPKDAPTNLAVIGRYLLSPTIFKLLKETEPGKGGEIQLTDAIAKLLEIEPVYAFKVDAKRYDVGDKLGYLEATVEYALRHPELGKGFLEYLKEKHKEGLF